MPSQLCFTADDEIVAFVENLSIKTKHSRSDVCNVLLWPIVKALQKNPPETFGDLISGGIGTTMNFEFAIHMLTENPPLQRWFLNRLQEETEKRVDEHKGVPEKTEGSQ